MTNILSTISLETVALILTEFQNPSKLALATSEVISEVDFQQATIELSKLQEIVKTHPPDIALLMLNEKLVAKEIIELLMQQINKSKDSKHSYTWRLDQSVPNVQAILLNITKCSTGETKTMRMDLSTFHKLRYNVSLLMKEHTALEKRVCK